MFAELIDKIIDEYKADPKNRIFIDENGDGGYRAEIRPC